MKIHIEAKGKNARKRELRMLQQTLQEQIQAETFNKLPRAQKDEVLRQGIEQILNTLTEDK